jgi:catalase
MADVEAAGGKTMLVAPKVGEIKLKGGKLKAQANSRVAVGAVRRRRDHSCAGGCREALAGERGRGFRTRCLRTLKAIGCTADAQPLLQKAGIAPDEG